VRRKSRRNPAGRQESLEVLDRPQCAERLVEHLLVLVKKVIATTTEELPAIVESLDEVVLILRTDAGIGFDPDIPSFHLYGTDVVQSAKLARRTSYVVDLPVIHHSRPLTNLA